MEFTTRPAITVSERDLERLEAMLAGLRTTSPASTRCARNSTVHRSQRPRPCRPTW